MASDPPSALISWSHSDHGLGEDEEDRRATEVRSLADLLRNSGVDAELDLYHSNAGVDWTRWGPEMARTRDFVLVVLSTSWNDAWEGSGDLSLSAGAAAEADVLKSMYARDRAKFVERVRLLVLPHAASAGVPSGLDGVTRYTINTIDEAGVEDLLRDLTGQPRYELPPLGPVPELPPDPPDGSLRSSQSVVGKVDSGRVPSRSQKALTSRQEVLIARAADPRPLEQYQWPCSAVREADDLVRLTVNRPEADRGRLMHCVVEFGNPPERRFQSLLDPLTPVAILRMGLDVDQMSVAFPGEFPGGHDLQPIPRGTYRYFWVANYGKLFQPGTRIVASGQFNWPWNR